MSISQRAAIPIYTTNGDPEAFLAYPYLFNRNGDWIGFVTANREVYSVIGFFVGTLTNDPRIIRKKATSTIKPRLKPLPKPQNSTTRYNPASTHDARIKSLGH